MKLANKPKAILFDLDDTLIDHQGALDLAIKDIFDSRQELQKAFSGLAELQLSWKNALKKFYPFFLAGKMTHEEQRIARVRHVWEMANVHLSEEDCLKISDEYLVHYGKHWKPLPATIPSLNAFADFKLGVVTNGWSHQQRQKLVKCGLEAHFQSVVVSSELGSAKPEARIFQTACQQLGVSPHEAVFVGDLYEADIVGAYGVGMTPVWLQKDSSQHANNPLGALCLTTLDELVPYLVS